MPITARRTCLLVATLLVACAAPVQTATPVEPKNQGPAELAVGQRWRYQTRAGDEASRVTILKIETLPNDATVVHVAVSAVRVPCRPEPTDIGHMPMSRDAVVNSVTALDATNVVLPDFQEGYQMWRRAYETQGAGFFTASLSEAIDAVTRGVCP
jgi:hypothetical protein